MTKSWGMLPRANKNPSMGLLYLKNSLDISQKQSIHDKRINVIDYFTHLRRYSKGNKQCDMSEVIKQMVKKKILQQINENS